jgi:hypothetical protein
MNTAALDAWIGALERVPRRELVLRAGDSPASQSIEYEEEAHWENLRVTQSFTGAYVVVDRAVIVGEPVEIYTERSARKVSLCWGQSGSPHDPHSATATRTAKVASTVPIR